MRNLSLRLLLLALIFAIACHQTTVSPSSSAERRVVTATPKIYETPLPKPECDRPPTRYAPTTLEGRISLYFDISSTRLEDELIIRYGDELIYQCRWAVSDPLTGAGYLFWLPIEKGFVRLEFENATLGLVETVEFEATAEKYISARLMAGNDSRVAWHIGVQDEPFAYE